MTEIGVVADTHDLIRPELLTALVGVERILHAGDLCRAETLAALTELAPVDAVRGNNDVEPFALTLPEARRIQIEEVVIWMCHDAADLERLPPPPETRIVIVGHSHKPLVEQADAGVMLNPGSPGRRRFSLPVSCARLSVDGDRFRIRLIEMEVAPPRRRRKA